MKKQGGGAGGDREAGLGRNVDGVRTEEPIGVG